VLFFADVVVMPLTLCWRSYDNLRVLLCYDGPVSMGFLFVGLFLGFTFLPMVVMSIFRLPLAVICRVLIFYLVELIVFFSCFC